MTVIGIDVGTVRVGCATADPAVRIAFPVGVWPRAQSQAERSLLQLIEARKASLLVVGLPLDRDGNRTKTCEVIETFVRRIAKRTSIKIEYVDEAFSSLEAAEKLSEVPQTSQVSQTSQGSPAARGAKRLDAFAACLILDRYFELNARDD